MLKRRFEWKDETELESGWVPAWNEHLNFPTSGFGAAHDVLEHFPKLGGMQGEMMAFGAMHFVRGDHYDWNSGDIYAAQMSDIARELVDYTWRGELPESPGRSVLSSNYIDSDRLREMVREAVVIALDEMVEGDGVEKNRAHFRRKMPSGIAQRIEGWIVKGAIAAERRYTRMGQSNGQEMAELFRRVMEDFDRVGKRGGEEGEFIDVMVNVKELEVTVNRGDLYSYTDE